MKHTYSSEQLFVIHRIQTTKPLTPGIIQEAVAVGMIPKKDLIDNQAYWGECRNAGIAIWHADEQQFSYLRTKFGISNIESIKHPEDDDGYDLFIPFGKEE